MWTNISDTMVRRLKGFKTTDVKWIIHDNQAKKLEYEDATI